MGDEGAGASLIESGVYHGSSGCYCDCIYGWDTGCSGVIPFASCV